ncbi:YaaC family protein, partial [Bacillus sp. GbtcB10]|uniref:YaaC family protein n=1 Tax=Bacillus sp. GbtcB10 TaxID=2824755 RepID=UPI001C2F1B07
GLEDERFTMINLLSKIPEMGHILELQKQPSTLVKVEQANGMLIQDHIPLHYNMSAERFIEYFELHTTWKLKQREAKKLTFDVFSE